MYCQLSAKYQWYTTIQGEYEDDTMSILAALKTGFSDIGSSSGSDSEQGGIQSVDLSEKEVIALDREDWDDSSS